MRQRVWIIFSLLVILTVGFLTARGCSKGESWVSPWSSTELSQLRQKLHPAVPAKKSVPAPLPAAVTPAQPKLAIVLDDWGNNYSPLKYALAVQRPLTVSILPNLPQSRRIAEEAFKNHLGVMLHLPMQPVSKTAPLEPHTILISMKDDEIQAIVNNAIAAIPHVQGVNNHMGSLATSDARVMSAALSVVQSHQLFFVDSNTIKNSKAAATAQKLGLPYAKRDVFLDNELNDAAVKKQLRLAIKMAKTHGKALAIGHDKKITLEAIKAILPEMDSEGVALVPVQELLENS